MWFGIYLVQKNVITPAQFVEAVELQLRSRPPLGQIAMEQGRIGAYEILEVLREQASSQRPFGQIAVQRRFLTEQDLACLLMIQFDRQRRFGEILCEMGLLDAATAQAEFTRFRTHASQYEDWARFALDGVNQALRQEAPSPEAIGHEVPVVAVE